MTKLGNLDFNPYLVLRVEFDRDQLQICYSDKIIEMYIFESKQTKLKNSKWHLQYNECLLSIEAVSSVKLIRVVEGKQTDFNCF